MGAGGVYTLVSFRKEQEWQRPLLPLQPTLPRRLALDGSLADMMGKVASPPAFLLPPSTHAGSGSFQHQADRVLEAC